MDKKILACIKKLEEKNISFENTIEECELDKSIISNNGKSWRMKSNASMELPTDIWCEQFENINDNAWIVIFGVGDLEYLVELTKRHKDNPILVYEPDERNILKQLAKEEMQILLLKENIIWIAGKNRKKHLCKIIDENIDYKNGVDIVKGKIPNYSKAYPEEYNFYIEQISLAKMYISVARNTRVKMEKERGKCFIYNINDIPEQSSVDKLVQAFEKEDMSEYPAVLIAAGPSLDKNIKDLVLYQDKVFIICLDSAIRTAVKWNIQPDLIICVDPIKNPELFNNDIGKNTPLITSLYCNYKITQIHNARRFYCSDKEPFEKDLYRRFQCNIGTLSTGGTVANTAFSLLISLGFKKIILIGQDLAYPNKKMHTKEAYAEEKIDESDDRFFYVDGIDGKPVLTEYNMFIYKKWYEEQVNKYPEIDIIDATEGGALIKGTVIKKLKTALSENCGRKKSFDEIIDNAEKLFNDKNESDKMKKIITETMENIPAIMRELKNTLDIYDKLETLNRKGKYNTNAFKKYLHEITIFNNKMDNSMEISLMQLFANEGDYEITDSLHEKTTSKYEEMTLMIRIGRRLIETYINAGEKLLEAREEVISN